MNPMVTEACAPYNAGSLVNPFWITSRLSRHSLEKAAVTLAIINPRQFETIVRDNSKEDAS